METEVEVRSFIDESKYNELSKFFKENATFVREDEQETHYFDENGDIRIQRNSSASRIWIKKGDIHGYVNDEIDVKFSLSDFGKIQKIMEILGFTPKIKWFRKRLEFEWDGIGVMLDFTRGYGHIIELEKVFSPGISGIEKEKALQVLMEKMQCLGVKITPKEEFRKRYEHYIKNWQELTRQ